MKVFVGFDIDDALALQAIEALLSNNEKNITKKKVIDLCKKHFHAEGELFEIEPNFTHGGEEVDFERAERVFSKIWL